MTSAVIPHLEGVVLEGVQLRQRNLLYPFSVRPDVGTGLKQIVKAAHLDFSGAAFHNAMTSRVRAA